MGVTDALARSAARHAHVLLVEVPGHWRTRATVERTVLTRGWILAMSPADADLLAVCGKPPPRLGEAIDVVWHQMPGPRVRVDVHDYDEVETSLDEAREALLDTKYHRHDGHTRPAAADLLRDNAGMDHGSMGHGDGGGHEGMDHASMGHGDGGGHEGMDHGGHGDMEMSPGGVPLAQGGEDRDGLEMDVLSVRLGPVLPHWPAGLVLRCALQGDVVTEAQAEFLDAEIQQRDAEFATGPARTLDNIVSLLGMAGWDDAAAEARRIRDAMLGGGDRAATAVRLHRLHRKVERSWVLRWSLRGIRPLSHEDLERHDLPVHLGGDTYARLLGMLDRACNDNVNDNGQPAAAFPVDMLPYLVTGLDLATARLVVASLDIHELQSGHDRHEVSHA